MAEQVEQVAVTGATGLVGRAVVAALVARRYEVVVLARGPRHRPGRRRLCGLPAGPGRRRRLALAAGQCRSRLVAAMQAAPRVCTLVNASSVGVYGFGPPSDEEVDEDTAPLPGRYAEGSAAWAAAAAAASPQARVVLLRMGYILTADGGRLPWQLQEARKDKASYFAPGTQWLPWIHLDDVVQFVMSALAEDRWHGAYNVVAPQAVRSREFAHTLTQVVESAPPRQAPAVLARVFVGAGADILLGGRRVTPARLNRAGYKFRHPTLENALAGGRR